MNKILRWNDWRVLVPVCLLVGFCFCWYFRCRGDPTIVFVIRHAEKATMAADPNDPPLHDPDGTTRANELARVLGGCGVKKVYVTEFQRTRLTAEPLATAAGAPITQLPKSDVAGVISQIRTTDRGKTILVTGHSDTAPDIASQLSGITVAPLTEGQFDRIFVVVMPHCGSKRLLSMKYGAPTP